MMKEISKPKVEEEMYLGPPKFFNGSKPTGSSQGSDKVSEKSSNSSVNGITKTKTSTPLQQNSKKSGKSNNKAPNANKDKSKSSANQKKSDDQQMNSNGKQIQKHANVLDNQNHEEEKKAHTVNKPPMMAARITPKQPSGAQPVYGYPAGATANPQCGYNTPVQPNTDPAYMAYLYEIYIYQKLSTEISTETEQITIMVDMIKKYRQEIKTEIENIAIQTFKDSHMNVQAHIYGSVATELALPESDMDIMITGVNSFGSKDAHQANICSMLDGLQEYFDAEIMSKSSKILNTQVPIIKLAFNLSKYYDIKLQNEQVNIPFINFDSIDHINPHLRELSVDVSISDSFNESAHLGLSQSYFVRDKLNQYPVLRPV
jgi:predicted nucleotidyltransferase